MQRSYSPKAVCTLYSFSTYIYSILTCKNIQCIIPHPHTLIKSTFVCKRVLLHTKKQAWRLLTERASKDMCILPWASLLSWTQVTELWELAWKQRESLRQSCRCPIQPETRQDRESRDLAIWDGWMGEDTVWLNSTYVKIKFYTCTHTDYARHTLTRLLYKMSLYRDKELSPSDCMC